MPIPLPPDAVPAALARGRRLRSAAAWAALAALRRALDRAPRLASPRNGTGRPAGC